jgi:Membrane proteins related to metalloendopeptidases
LRELDRSYSYPRSTSTVRYQAGGYSKTGSKLFRFDKKMIQKMANQSIAACAIALLIIIMSNFDVKFINSIVGGAKWVVGENYDFKANTAVLTNSVLPGITQKIKEAYNSVGSMFKKNNAVNASTNNTIMMIMPVEGEITSAFGSREDPITHQVADHDGIDIANKSGTPIKAALDGVVVKVEENNSTLGRMVRIKHDGGLETIYGHCSEILVKENQTIKQGDIIAKVGNTGSSTGDHLHFSVLKDGNYVNPTDMIGTVTESK